MSREATLAARWLHEPQPISNQPAGFGFPHPLGRYRPRGSACSSSGCCCRDLEGFVIRGWELILPGCAGSKYDPQPISDRPVGLGFPHCVGRCRPGGTPFSSPGCRSCTCMEGFLIREWKPILPGVSWLYVRSPASQRPAGAAGVSTPCGAVSTRGITVFVPALSEL